MKPTPNHENRPDLIVSVRNAIIASAGSFGLSARVANDLARQVEDRVRLEVGGTDLRWIGRVDRARRARELKQRFDGTNLKAVAAELGISERRARQILYGK